MRNEEWVYQAVAERADEIRAEFGYNEELNEDIDSVLNSLEQETKKVVDGLVDRVIRSYLDDIVSVYRGAFRDGLRYGVLVFYGDRKEESDAKK